jgi:hypothetical protein
MNLSGTPAPPALSPLPRLLTSSASENKSNSGRARAPSVNGYWTRVLGSDDNYAFNASSRAGVPTSSQSPA